MNDATVELYNEGLDDLIHMVNEARFRINASDLDGFQEAIRALVGVAGAWLSEPAEAGLILLRRERSHALLGAICGGNG
ncbi:MAG: hypothetical protein ACRDJV_09060 [Actinomycetota bacterium]